MPSYFTLGVTVQIRIANRQDEPEIRTFVEALYQKSGLSFELESKDSDLRNVEANYFGKEGLFLVAENEGAIVGIAGARKKSESDLEIKRFLVADNESYSASEVRADLLKVIVEFAPRMLYSKIELSMETADGKELFIENGFAVSDSQSLSLAVTADF